MNQSQGLRQGPLAPDTGKKMDPEACHCFLSLGRTAALQSPALGAAPGPASLCSTPCLGSPAVGVVRGVRELGLQPCSYQAFGSEGAAGRGARALPSSPLPSAPSCSDLGLLVHLLSKPESTAQTQRGWQKERRHLTIQN